MATSMSWLVLIYRVPTEPTRLRATVWRRLKAMGAVYLQSSVVALPDSTNGERALRALRNEIGEMGGSAQLLRSDVLAGESDVTSRFNGARNEEYAEVVDRCKDFLTEIATETAAQHFTYAELEENDEDLTKLRNWLEKIRARDVLGASGVDAAREALEECASALEGFATHVYEVEDGDAATGSP